MDYVVYRKNDLRIRYQFVDAAGAPVPLAGYDFAFHVSTPLEIQKSLGSGIEIVDAEQSIIEVWLAADDLDVAPGGYPFSFKIEAPDGDESTREAGNIVVLPCQAADWP